MSKEEGKKKHRSGQQPPYTGNRDIVLLLPDGQLTPSVSEVSPSPERHPLVVQSASKTTALTPERSSSFCHRARVALPPSLSLLLPSPPTHPVGPVTWGPILWFTAMHRFRQHQLSVSDRSGLIKCSLERQRFQMYIERGV